MKAARFLAGIIASQSDNGPEEDETHPAADCPFAALRRAADALEEVGVHVDLDWSPESAVMVAEACNLAAKVLDEDFYALKPPAIEAAIALGADGGWGVDGCFYLSTPETGVACFHDPFGQIRVGGFWPNRWSGVQRQHAAFLIATRPAVRRLYAEATIPGGAIAGISDSAVRRALRRLAALDRRS